MSTVKWRIPAREDLAAILGLMDDPASVHRRTICRHGSLPESPEQLDARLRLDENLLGEKDGKGCVAFASWQWVDIFHAHINVMAVAGHVQRQGLGTALFRTIVTLIRRRGAQSLTLRAFADSPWALSFYEGLGLSRLVNGGKDRTLPDGVHLYLAQARAHGTWPDDQRVLFYQDLRVLRDR
ncbi:MAG: GNAT family N-acetyltransferase [Candidatus Sericytochromatia bacterium]|nr:GNAT family N-acetyltransferase [Candidatus Sericytochromatia bacterium]